PVKNMNKNRGKLPTIKTSPIKFSNAYSSKCFGDIGENIADKKSPFMPSSPYALAKAASFWHVANYCEAYGLFTCCGTLFNHEFPLGPERFVTKKIVATAYRIAAGSRDKLHLGNISF
ncbi:unnamed protein product, partial [marine sediment metagenome]